MVFCLVISIDHDRFTESNTLPTSHIPALPDQIDVVLLVSDGIGSPRAARRYLPNPHVYPTRTVPPKCPLTSCIVSSCVNLPPDGIALSLDKQPKGADPTWFQSATPTRADTSEILGLEEYTEICTVCRLYTWLRGIRPVGAPEPKLVRVTLCRILVPCVGWSLWVGATRRIVVRNVTAFLTCSTKKLPRRVDHRTWLDSSISRPLLGMLR